MPHFYFIIIKNMNLGENKNLFDHPQYDQIREVLAIMKQQNLIDNGAGFCTAMSDLLYQRLVDAGIPSKLVECELVIECSDPHQITVVGGSKIPNQENQVGTHVVVLTEHDHPLLIDTSIKHLLPDPFGWVCALTDTNGTSLAIVRRGNWTLTYRAKIGQQFPRLHQENIVERIQLDQQIRRYIQWGRTGLVTISLLVVTEIVLIFSNNRLIENNTQRHFRNRERIEFLEKRIDHLERQIDSLQSSKK